MTTTMMICNNVFTILMLFDGLDYTPKMAAILVGLNLKRTGTEFHSEHYCTALQRFLFLLYRDISFSVASMLTLGRTAED